jgi:hypothetical protein
MKQIIRVMAAAAALAAVALSPAAIAGDQDFTINNETGVEIYQVFTSPASTNEWQEDVMGADTLPDGESVEISFDGNEEAELWDLKVADSEGNSIVWTRLNLMEISTLTLHYENGKAWADAE